MNVRSVMLLTVSTLLLSSTTLSTNEGGPWTGKAQQIPGRVENEFFDLGGEGIAYHDSDSINNGSGKLNPANGTLLNEFRMKEGVDISYTKSNNVDDHAFNKVKPEMNKLYVGWTTPGEWINYTVDVMQSGTYQLGLRYTSHDEGGISLLADGKKVTGIIKIPSTYDSNDTIAWRQWHHWNEVKDLAELNLKRGKHVLTLKTEVNGNMNYDFMLFTLKK